MTESPEFLLDRLARVIRTQRYRYVSEMELQDGIALTLHTEGLDAAREVSLSATERIDFLTPSGIGIEVKVARRAGLGDVMRQMERYARHDKIKGLILVTDRRQLARLPLLLDGKPVRAVALMGGLV